MADFSKLRNFYWHIRFTRNKVTKRRYYRYVLKEKKRLIGSGVDAEFLRLFCRALSNRLDCHAEKRLESYRKSNFLTYRLYCSFFSYFT